MAWQKSTTTKHTCGGPVFGKKTPGCPRCDELLAGAEPVVWRVTPAYDPEAHRRELAAHRARCVTCSGGGGVCTWGDW